MKACWVLLLVAMVSYAGAMPAGSNDSAAMERKIQRIESNGSSRRPQPLRTQFSESEINAYVGAHKADLPDGIQSLHFVSEPGVVTATVRADFDKIKAGSGSFNPLLEIFSGAHDVVVVARAHGDGGMGFVQVDTVAMDGVEIPRFALQVFVDKYVTPRYPGLGLDSKFALPDGIDSAVVGAHELTVIQK